MTRFHLTDRAEIIYNQSPKFGRYSDNFPEATRMGLLFVELTP